MGGRPRADKGRTEVEDEEKERHKRTGEESNIALKTR